MIDEFSPWDRAFSNYQFPYKGLLMERAAEMARNRW